MSLVTLKRKSNVLYKVQSKNGFSLNGGHRNQGYIGQTTTRFSISFVEDPEVIKKSTLSSKGMLQQRYQWVRRPYPFSSVKSVQSAFLDTTSYELYNNKKKENIAKIIDDSKSICGTKDNMNPCINLLRNCDTKMFKRSYQKSNFLNTYGLYRKTWKSTGASLTSDTFMEKLRGLCNVAKKGDESKRYYRAIGIPLACKSFTA